MKVLLVIADYSNGAPFIQDLEKALRSAGLEVDVFDIYNMWHRKNGTKVQFASKWLIRFKSKRVFGTLFSCFFTKRYLKKLKGYYDAVNIHSCEHIYYYLIDDFAKVSNNLSVMIWGSDFYRISYKMREEHRKIFNTVKFIVFGNPENAKDFTSYYNSYENKSLIAGFGVKHFEYIKEKLNETTNSIRGKLDLPVDKIIISCGYNGREMQQHLLLLDEISKLSQYTINKIFLILQLGYGTSEEYLEKILGRLEKINLPYKIFDKYLNDEEIAMLRIVPDITLNAQISDGFSSSIQEHLYAKNILIVGDWLPYNFLKDKGLFFISCPIHFFHKEIENAIIQIGAFKNRTERNTVLIDSISGWHQRVEEWKKVYTGDISKLKYKKH